MLRREILTHDAYIFNQKTVELQREADTVSKTVTSKSKMVKEGNR